MEGISEEQQVAWLRLSTAELPPTRLRLLLESFQSDAAALMAASTEQLRAVAPDLSAKQRERLAAASRRDVDNERGVLERLGAHLVPFSDPTYPSGLRPLVDAPPLLYVRGALLADDKFSLAVVGSRRASSYGLSIAERFSRELAARGLTIVSGGARGIDTRAHRGALEASGRTIAFIGCGLDVNYPTENKKLFEEIVSEGHGAVVTEFALGTTPEPWRFPARNRLISGTALGTLVIESPIDSGALITATDAANQGREVFAIPGPIETGKNAGCHKLIQEGAKLVQSPQDILDELGILALTSEDSEAASAGRLMPVPAGLPPEQQRLLEMLTLQARHVDSLIAESGYTAPQVTGILTLLEMRGLARRVPGNAFVRVL
ncbi:MAG TPA: DNA-processing protein DprA [Capsulimonadaceae bacterium]|nr:DNA-processing protein DprA [Capsulimonadaceae bacterium]